MSETMPNGEQRPQTDAAAEAPESNTATTTAPGGQGGQQAPAGQTAAGQTTPGQTAPGAGGRAAAGEAPADDRTASLEAEIQVLKDQLLRALAETENVRRRAEREREDTAKYAIAKFAKDLLAVADNLRRAVESVAPDQRQGNEAVNSLLTGVEATERQLAAAFDRAGIQKMEPLDRPFDPNFHQVMMEMEGTGKAPGTVVAVLQAGYTLQGRLLREAMVGVAKGGETHNLNTSA
ncbi:nucleotide exchange factor GrpE [Rhodospirillum centenum]|uniref:Protein GrpE n=1 Tax=Rhodospirillum centenum (strain ATCC 51521 / SW) TaxID=414684 RepID=B6IVK0_RHOCS|nr:nucleotide exchange factor GrpE [Rhodospirillum centenum]ACJ00324.1 co-chaperone GrpE, putative [Rhodospirillum centenum SW]